MEFVYGYLAIGWGVVLVLLYNSIKYKVYARQPMHKFAARMSKLKPRQQERLYSDTLMAAVMYGVRKGLFPYTRACSLVGIANAVSHKHVIEFLLKDADQLLIGLRNPQTPMHLFVALNIILYFEKSDYVQHS